MAAKRKTKARAKKPKGAPPQRGKLTEHRHWPKLRAAIITFFVVFNVLGAIPSPGHVTKEKLERPIARAELARWVSFLQSIGIDTTPDGLADWYVGFAAGFEDTKWKAITPILPFMHWTQTHQGWRLFGTPDERPYSLKVVGISGGVERLLYQSGDFEHRWGSSLLEFRRIRAQYNPGRTGPTNTYKGFCQQLAERVFADLPDVDVVRISILRTHTTLPHEAPDPSVEEKYVVKIARGR